MVEGGGKIAKKNTQSLKWCSINKCKIECASPDPRNEKELQLLNKNSFSFFTRRKRAAFLYSFLFFVCRSSMKEIFYFFHYVVFQDISTTDRKSLLFAMLYSRSS